MSPIQNKIKKSFDIPEYKTGEGEMMMLISPGSYKNEPWADTNNRDGWLVGGVM
tara:strand:+ start:648 stop:809 length:162 start_codon:yes stop_codon:yes gene_type:complete